MRQQLATLFHRNTERKRLARLGKTRALTETEQAKLHAITDEMFDGLLNELRSQYYDVQTAMTRQRRGY